MQCPVCYTVDIADDAAECPQCKSDLDIFRLLSEAGRRYRMQKRLMGIMGILFACALIGWASAKISSSRGKAPFEEAVTSSPEVVQMEQTGVEAEGAVVSEENTRLMALKAENDSLKAEIYHLQEKIKALTQQTSVHTQVRSRQVASTATGKRKAIIHTVKKGESLWDISKKYFGTGTKTHQIAKDNGIAANTTLREGTKLTIYK